LRLFVGLTSTVDIRDLRKKTVRKDARSFYRPRHKPAARRSAPLKTPEGSIEAALAPQPKDIGAP
jgi:hypothetical protein